MFEHIDAYPGDPILTLNENFQKDPRTAKVNLSIGIYFDADGKIPVMQAVREAETALQRDIGPKPYLPMVGMAPYRDAVQALVFGADHPARASGRIATVQTLGGSGALKIGADFLKRYFPDAQVWLSDPSWENHRFIFERAGFTVNTYPYYDEATGGLKFDAMLAAIDALPRRSIVLLHACCHNPTGVDPDEAQWDVILETVRSRGLVPLLDIAYQGFGAGIEQDGAIVRRFAATPGPLFIASSFSKSFSLYGERIGALTVVAGDAEEVARITSQLKRVVRANYSSPPTHGAAMVAAVLTTPALRELWEIELGGMRERIREMRKTLVEKLASRLPGRDFSFVTRQRGMFSYSGLSAEQVRRLRDEFSVYAIATGRVCVAALNTKNIDYVADAIAAVSK